MKIQETDLILGRKMIIFNGKKSIQTSIKKIIPMHMFVDGVKQPRHDIEIITNSSRNYFISINAYNEGKSWAKRIWFSNDYDRRVRSDDD